MDEFEYDISHLIHAMTVLGLFGFCVPMLFWVLTQCMSMQALYLTEWVCLYGYSFVPFMPATILCLIPLVIVEWISLSLATAISAIFILRNVAGPLLAADVTQQKSGPLLLAILGTHVILLLTLKLAFYHHK
jgi:protein YIPF1/2